MKFISKFALLIVIVVILYLLLSGNLLSPSPILITVQLFAVGLSLWARRSFSTHQFNIHANPKDGQLLRTGPYQFIRHPMYAAALIIIWSGILAHPSSIHVILGVIASGVIATRIMVEEKLLRAHYHGYSEYEHKTRRIIPFII